MFCKNPTLKILQNLQRNTPVLESSFWTSGCREGFCKNEVLENFPKLKGKHLCQSLFFNKVAGLKCFLWIFIEERLPFFKNAYIIYRTSLVAASDSFRFPTSNFNKRKTSVKMFLCEFSKILKNIFRQKHLQMTVSCGYLWILRIFSDHLFYKARRLISFRSC